MLGTLDSFAISPRELLLTAYQNVPPAPGREGGTQAPAAPPPEGPGPGGPGAIGGLLPLLLVVVPMLLLLFFSSRSQQKRYAAVIAGLKRGDRVLTQSGLVGRFVEMKDRFAILEIAPGVKVEVLKSSIAGNVDMPGVQASLEKK
nr:MAG: preprotein translocase subunit YajC [Pseudomonadota bacterium]